ncbi:MAG: lamin tail domain-containing protein [Planctomycetes bacterium]|nr:lamin tail domain-containing protein [Planctomycetota bacterium]
MLRIYVVVLVLALSTACLPAQVLINEIDTSTPDFIELLNVGSTAVNIGGWTLQSWVRTSAATVLTAETLFTFPAGTMIGAQGFLAKHDSATGTVGGCSSYVGFNYSWTDMAGVEIVLKNAAGVGVDYVFRNPYGGAASPNLPAGTTWAGIIATTGNNVRRINITDTNTAGDWAVVATGPTGCALNPGQAFPPPTPAVSMVVTSPSVGNIAVSISTFPARPNAEFYAVYSFQNFTPNGSGPFFGVGFDVLPQIMQPLIPGSPFHGLLDGGGNFAFASTGMPAGFFIEATCVVIDGVNLVGPAAVDETTF